MTPTTLRYEVTGRIARITLARPERGNGITLAMPRELAECVEEANLNPAVHVIALAGEGKGFCGGYDLVEYAETQPPGHDPGKPWDPVVDWQMMSRNLRGFMSLFHSDKPVVCKVHGFCVAGGTDMALCSDLLVIAADARIGYPPARVWGVPTSALWAFRVGDQRAKRLLFTGDLIDGATALEWGLARGGAGGCRARQALRGAARADRSDTGEPARDDEAAREPGAVRAGPARHAGARRLLRRHRAPHA
jgi:enoyl-CoA hydratase